jgi:hypothetical protein
MTTSSKGCGMGELEGITGRLWRDSGLPQGFNRIGRDGYVSGSPGTSW